MGKEKSCVVELILHPARDVTDETSLGERKHKRWYSFAIVVVVLKFTSLSTHPIFSISSQA